MALFSEEMLLEKYAALKKQYACLPADSWPELITHESFETMAELGAPKPATAAVKTETDGTRTLHILMPKMKKIVEDSNIPILEIKHVLSHEIMHVLLDRLPKEVMLESLSDVLKLMLIMHEMQLLPPSHADALDIGNPLLDVDTVVDFLAFWIFKGMSAPPKMKLAAETAFVLMQRIIDSVPEAFGET